MKLWSWFGGVPAGAHSLARHVGLFDAKSVKPRKELLRLFSMIGMESRGNSVTIFLGRALPGETEVLGVLIFSAPLA